MLLGALTLNFALEPWLWALPTISWKLSEPEFNILSVLCVLTVRLFRQCMCHGVMWPTDADDLLTSLNTPCQYSLLRLLKPTDIFLQGEGSEGEMLMFPLTKSFRAAHYLLCAMNVYSIVSTSPDRSPRARRPREYKNSPSRLDLETERPWTGGWSLAGFSKQFAVSKMPA